MKLKPDPTFYATPAEAADAAAEKLAYVVPLNTGTNGDAASGRADRGRRRPDSSSSYGTVVGRLDMPNAGDELHHFGWNACSSVLCPNAPHPHVERRYLIVPGLGSSRIHVVDTKPDPRQPKIVKMIEPEEIAARDRLQPSAHRPLRPRRDLRRRARRAGRRRARAASSCSTTTTSTCWARWEIDRGAQYLAYDFWWHLGYDT